MFPSLFRWLVMAVLCVLLPIMLPLTASAHSSVGASAQASLAVSPTVKWSGYTVLGSSTHPVTYSRVVGSWRVPLAICSGGETSAAAFWVGLGGAAGIQTLEQTGTASDCIQGKPLYYAWYEMVPAPGVPLSPTAFAVSPGDAFKAEVIYVGRGVFVLALQDTTEGWQFRVSKLGPTAARARGSAEWIAEAPIGCLNPPSCTHSGLEKLTDFGTVSFSECLANGEPISTGPVIEKDVMTTNGTLNGMVKAEPLHLRSSGTAFSVTWYHH